MPSTYRRRQVNQQAAKSLGKKTVQKELAGLEYSISWGTMNLQTVSTFLFL